ncbi:conserved membrane hypothetical protein [Desulfosarcina cetonica]|uniref:DUF350 domain-containing protein n=1 Tax=Desulfosarcina cetonica TaxID=90730 RepID=UPI0006D215AC|nr:DUF350 domain-containing protein [Desulfosarcina cetonica]VTR69315.1 conserved membrane hypothetical protein [Desulfosarcina cetonica]
MQTLQQPFAHFFARMPYFAILLLLLLLGILLFRKTLRYTRASGEPFDFDKELTDRDNPAFGIYFAGYIVGLTIALTGTLSGVGTDPANALIGIAINSLVAIVLMRLGTFVNDRFILYRFDDKKEIIDDRNAGTAFVYLGSFLATGLMINGILTGESASVLLMLRDVIIYWVVGQIILIIGGRVFQLISHYDVQAVIEEDNVAAGICFGFFLAAQGAVARLALAGASSDILGELVTVAVYATLGTVLLCTGRYAADKVLLPASPLDQEIARDGNMAAAAVVAATFSAIAILLAF